MNIYQKAIKVRKTCENTKWCQDCEYFVKCDESLILQIDPKCENIIDCVNGCPYFNQCTIKKLDRFIPEKLKIETLAEAIQKEKWDVK